MEKRQPKILIVDDELLNRELLEAYLEFSGYSGTSVSDGLDALEAISSQRFDLVLLDVMMPGIDGLETALRIRKTHSHADLPIIMVTALSAKEDRLKAVEAGANDFITKPVDRLELNVRVASQLKIKVLQDDLKQHQVNLEYLIEERTKELRQALEEAERSKKKLLQVHLDTIKRLGIAAEFRDEDTGAHVSRIGGYCELIARGLNLADEDVNIIKLASPMHDIGKIGVPDSILLKPGKLTAEEWEIMKKHTIIGAQILDNSDSPLLHAGKIIALSHHEKWDGHGYPYGLKGERIPLSGRICAIADVFDALTSKRPYKEAYPIDEALKIIKEGRGTHFDPLILNIFFQNLGEILAVRSTYQW